MSTNTIENKREAVNIGISLSNQLISTSLALVAVVGAAVTFIMQQKDVGFWFYLLSILAFISFLISIYFGGRGINSARNKGFNGNWDIIHGATWFDYQTKAMIIGVISLCFLFFTGKEKTNEIQNTLEQTNQILLKQVKTIDDVTKKLLLTQKNEIDRLTSKVSDLEETIEKNCKEKNK